MPQKTARDSYSPRAGSLIRAMSLWRHMRRLEREGHHTAIRQIWELIQLKARRGIGPAFYLRAGLYRRELSWSDKLAYVGGEKYDRLMHRINSPEHDHFTRNKLECYRILRANGIPTPEVYGIVEGVSGTKWDGPVLRSADDLMTLIGRLGTDTVCFKFVTGTRGRGFYKVRVNAGAPVPMATIEPSGKEVPLQEFWETLRQAKLFKGYFCQAAIDQHPDVARFNPSSVNTARTWMVRTQTGEWRMYCANLRMGLGKTAVDNISAGGIAPAIDITTGRLSSAIQRRVDRPIHVEHPISSARIEGSVLPMWQEAKALCQRAAALFPYYSLVSADIAFGKQGPLVVELGSSPDEMQVEWGSGVYPVLRELIQKGCVEDPGPRASG